MDIEEMKKHQFKAHPVNRQVLAHGGLCVRRVRAEPATVVQPFKLSSWIHHVDRSSASEDSNLSAVFHARPVPKYILSTTPCSTFSVTLIRNLLF